VQTVVATQSFDAAVKATKMSEGEVDDATDTIAGNPQGGVVLAGTGGVRKARLAGRGKGKSGGYRVVWWFGGGDIPVFLLTVFGKDEKDNLSQAERNALKRLTATLRDSLGTSR
jgi:hypothetical protein